MASGQPAVGRLGTLRTLLRVGTVSGTDGELLERFASRDDEGAEHAFRALVERHGAMVARVCRDVIGDPHEAQDASQAVFLVLARRAGSIRRRESVESWLYGVALRVSARARGEAARRRVRERRGAKSEADLTVVEGPRTLDWSELHEEIGRLPERYRVPILLCYFEGLTHEEAAARLAWPVGTVKTQLSRGRERLRTRLTRRGLDPSAGVFAAFPRVLPTRPPINFPIPAATSFAAGRALAAGEVPARALALARGVLRTMFWTKLKTGSTVALLAAALVAGIGLTRREAVGDPPEPRREASQKASARPEPRPAPDPKGTDKERSTYVVEPPDLLIVEVLEALPGRPISGERLVRPDGTISLGFYGDLQVAGMTLVEVKEKVIHRLQKYLPDETLGLKTLSDNGTPDDDKDDKMVPVAPKDSDRVFVDVTAYNSKVYYVDGDVATPGRLPVTGRDTILDAIHYAGGLLPTASPTELRLIRKNPKKGADEILRINYEDIVSGIDSATNYSLQPGDRIFVPRIKRTGGPGTRPDPDEPDRQEIRGLEQRLENVERKLDQILRALDKPRASAPEPYFQRPPDSSRPAVEK